MRTALTVREDSKTVYAMLEPTKDIMIEAIHRAIHKTGVFEGGQVILAIDGQELPIRVSANGCRFINYMGITFMEQNKNKNSVYAKRARAGEHITWGIRINNWLFITDHAIQGKI